MKPLSELGISPAPWRFSDNGMGECDIRCSGVSYGEGYEGEDIIASGVQKKDAPMFAAAPKLYSAGYNLLRSLEEWMTYYPPSEWSTMGQAFQLLGEAQDRLRAALAEAAGEEVSDGREG